jgi:hypothetical protein
MSDDDKIGRAPADEPPTAEEAATAAALRRALDLEAAAGPARADVEAAAFLGFSRDAGALAPDRAEAVLRRVLAQPPAEQPAAAAEQPAAAPVRARGRRAAWRWAMPVAACAAAAAALLAVGARRGGTALPAPPAALLRAQVRAARVGGAAMDLEPEMRAYRQRLFAALGERYRSAP